jgi:hypothetical protein
MKKFIFIGLILLVIFGIYFYYKEHLIISGREVEKKAENYITSVCTVNKHEGGLWSRDVKIKVNRVKAKLFDSSYLAIICNLDVKWREGAFFFSVQPTISGYGKLVQIRDKIYIVDINFTKIDILNNSPIGNFCNESLKNFINNLYVISGKNYCFVRQDDRLNKYKIRIDSTGVYAKVK